MCEYCEKDKTLLEKDEIVSNMSFGWGDVKIDRSECSEYTLSVFIDRGYLRLVDKEDSGCLDHGERIALRYCPMCGHSFNGI